MPGWTGPVALYMLRGLKLTLVLAIVCTGASIVLGIVIGVLLCTNVRPLVAPLRLYVELWRGLPLIVILFAVFFVLPALGYEIGATPAAGVGLALWGSAEVAENVRGAILSISRGQFDAARALGFRWLKTMRLVILPQAIRRLLPPTLNVVTSLVHGTSLAAQLGALELLESGRRSIERLALSAGGGHQLEILGAILVIYFLICYPLVVATRWLEKRRVV